MKIKLRRRLIILWSWRWKWHIPSNSPKYDFLQHGARTQPSIQVPQHSESLKSIFSKTRRFKILWKCIQRFSSRYMPTGRQADMAWTVGAFVSLYVVGVEVFGADWLPPLYFYHVYYYVGHLESKERLRIQPAQLFTFSWWVMWCVQ